MHDEMMQGCALSRWTGGAHTCRWCDKPLPKRRRRWCSDACAGDAVSNHWWTAARHAALKRDGFRCVKCPTDAKPHGMTRGGLQVHHRDEHAAGRHSKTSCCHHVDGLETLCHDHHVDEHTTTTNGRARRQRRANERAQLTLAEMMIEELTR